MWLQRIDFQGITIAMNDMPEYGLKVGWDVRLTPAQRMAAESEWRKALQAKTKAEEIKERERVVVDREFEEWE